MKMTALNTLLQSAATALLTLGVVTLGTNVWIGIVELAVGVVAYYVYEKTPESQ